MSPSFVLQTPSSRLASLLSFCKTSQRNKVLRKVAQIKEVNTQIYKLQQPTCLRWSSHSIGVWISLIVEGYLQEKIRKPLKQPARVLPLILYWSSQQRRVDYLLLQATKKQLTTNMQTKRVVQPFATTVFCFQASVWKLKRP